MKNVIILHGMQPKKEYFDRNTHSPSNGHWIPWLQKQVLVEDIHAHTPEVPNSWMPEYDKWQKEIERYDITNETVLVGHSCGGGFFIRWLSENKHKTPAKVILVAPWIDKEGKIPKELDMFDFVIDPELSERTELVVYSSDNDMDEIKSSVEELRLKIPGLNIVNFEGYGHFCEEDMNTVEFPELLKEVLA